MASEHEDRMRGWFRTFQAKVGELRLDPNLIGRFFVVSESGIASNHTTFEEAYRDGIARFGQGQFIVQQLEPEDTVNFICEVF